MCELLGMNCNVPTDICFSFTGFSTRGGGTAEHNDGWGIAFFEGKGCRTFIDIHPAAESPIARLVREYPIKSLNVIAHIRRATVGEVALENTHPFMREFWGQYWIFAHNGDLKEFAPRLSGDIVPVGTTDTERAFCYILDRLRKRFPAGEPAKAQLFETLRGVVDEIAGHGSFNFLMSNGEYLFAHCSTELAYIVRRHPFTTAHLVDQDVTVDFSELTEEGDRVAVIATAPLTDDETWTRFAPGELIVFEEGRPIERL
jgi:glutamine amidotransferase